MKKTISALIVLAISAVMLFAVVGCSNSGKGIDGESITIKAYNANKVVIDVEVPKNPKRVAVLDMPSLDIIDALGVGDRVVGCTSVSIDYLKDKYNPSSKNGIANIGTIKEADMIEVAASKPDIIFIGGRLAEVYDELEEIAPVVFLGVDTEKGVFESTLDNARTIAKIFDKESEIEDIIEEYKFESRLADIKSKYEGKSAIVGLYSGNSFSLLGNDGKCSLIGVEFGFNNIGLKNGEVSATHGNEASWETIKTLNPEYMFVLDRNTAIGSAGSTAVKDAIENDLVKTMDVYKNGNIIYFSNPTVWYTAEGGLQALNIMISDLEK